MIKKASPASNALCVRNIFHGLHDEPNKAIPLATDAIHDGNTIDVDATDVYPKLRCLANCVRGLGGSNK